MVKQIETVKEVAEFGVETPRLFSATHEEIRRGLTTDIYFVKTKEILAGLHKEDTAVTAEIFARRGGIFAGAEEAKVLLDNLGLEVWSLPEGAPFEAKEVVMRIHGTYASFGIYETAILGIWQLQRLGHRSPQGEGSRRWKAGLGLWGQACPSCSRL